MIAGTRLGTTSRLRTAGPNTDNTGALPLCRRPARSKYKFFSTYSATKQEVDRGYCTLESLVPCEDSVSLLSEQTLVVIEPLHVEQHGSNLRKTLCLNRQTGIRLGNCNRV